MSASKFSVADRKRLAAQLDISEQYLYQCLRGLRDMNPEEARRCEDESHGELMRWDICQKTWRGIWRELANDPRAPSGGEVEVAPAPGAPNDRRHLERRSGERRGIEARGEG